MKRLLAIFMSIALIATGCSANSESSSEGNDGSSDTPSGDVMEYEVSAGGYGGELVLNVVMENGSLSDIEVVSSKETSVVFDRAFPIIKERIIEAQSPIVDNVSGATISSFAVKKAVGDAFAQSGEDFGEISVATEPEKVQAKELADVDTQLVIVGGGASGLTAAISAKQNNVENVILIEKLDILSGNAKFNLEFYDHYNSQAQKNAGVEITKEEFIESKAGTIDSRERVQVWADEGYNLDEWLRNMNINLNATYGYTGHMAEQDMYAGEHIQAEMEKLVYELGVDVRTGTKGTDLIIENGVVTGVKVENDEGYYNITADAVIIATGGFSSNKDMLASYAPGTENLATSNQMGTTGDFVPVFEANNIALANMDFTRIFKNVLTSSRHLTGGGSNYILVNNEGNRFVDETKEEMEIATPMLSQSDGEVYYVYGQGSYDEYYRLRKHNELGYYMKAETIEELAEMIGVDANNLRKSIEGYNGAVAGDAADEFRGELSDTASAIEGPFYAAKVMPTIHMTKGGVVANENAQVVYEDGSIVPNLYAAGEVTSVSGGYQVSVVFGKIAGQEAAKQITNPL